ncbi:lysine-epsilon-oxidase maturase LodB [Polaribacter sp. Hel_I_88]|uniref:lysine-epsilon-oxidase maturase LodB n=1 Tax=Polaribacter sp. Hel_I_88 TaxID=1250006 RepID=UPI00047A2AB3|nr:lysine-epsilon-oxidase maturase LodB [Polaribacter sp. Hel_I_88]
MPDSMRQTDVLIVGGGPSGASAALSLLNHSKYNVTIIEQSDFNTTRVGEHVSTSIFGLIEYLKLSKGDFEKDSFMPSYASKAYWGNDEVSTINTIFTADEATFQLDRQKFDFKLIETAAERGATIYPRTKCLEYEQLADKSWRIFLNHATEGKFIIHANYLVDASGRSANVCRKIGGISKKYDSLMSVGMFFDLNEGYKKFEQVIESVELGWWYAACLPDNRMVIVFFSDADIISENKIHQINKWSHLIQQSNHIKNVLQENHSIGGKLWVKNAQTQVSDTRTLERFIAIGDAAASFDPISSMGIGFSISSAIYAAKHIAQEFKEGISTIDSYQEDILKNFNRYHQIKTRYYNKEKRWSPSKFWQRRNL